MTGCTSKKAEGDRRTYAKDRQVRFSLFLCLTRRGAVVLSCFTMMSVRAAVTRQSEVCVYVCVSRLPFLIIIIIIIISCGRFVVLLCFSPPVLVAFSPHFYLYDPTWSSRNLSVWKFAQLYLVSTDPFRVLWQLLTSVSDRCQSPQLCTFTLECLYLCCYSVHATLLTV